MTSAGARRVLYLVGPSGYPNFGDELIAATWLRHLARTDPGADVWLDTHSPGPAQLLLGDLHPRLRCTDTLWRLCGEAPSDEPEVVADWVRAAVRDPGLAPRWDAGIELLGRADVLHVIGGGYLNALWPRHIGLLAGVAAAASRSGARTAMTGQGLVPFPRGAEGLLRSSAADFDVVDARDEPSAELLARGVSTCDDVFLDLPAPALQREAREFVVCVQSDIGRAAPVTRAARLLAVLRAWRVDPRRLAIVEGIPRVDRTVPAFLESELDGAEFVPFREVWRRGLPAAPGQTWISSRYHMHLLAAAAGATGLAVSFSSEYYTPKHRGLLRLGSGWSLSTPSDSGSPRQPTGGGFPPEVLRRCRELKRSVADAIYGTRPAGDVAAAPLSVVRRLTLLTRRPGLSA
ncbi:polysaccharide pyruvyl transferase family protein [Amycolatopsis nalaikhensis]|uniref:Polysaccharide pyruvyl transferase family protein n=2 Tax=Amycolatopsis TaxID=1813 RepID=A0ABY8XL30_9PSEU|nr:polysaccharide pyruvyl transferase family protein [Amycolatopsis sp. 2-2]WIV56276.1 polysaccharide pyruvyl transferase family protein [Amycolatopsis sp. 2-2]